MDSIFPAAQTPFEPSPGQECNLFECARFLKEMSRTGDDLQAFLAGNPGEGFAVQFQYGLIFAAYDQQRRGLDLAECGVRPDRGVRRERLRLLHLFLLPMRRPGRQPLLCLRRKTPP